MAQWQGALSFLLGEELACLLPLVPAVVSHWAMGGDRPPAQGMESSVWQESRRVPHCPIQKSSAPQNTLLLGKVPILFPRLLPMAGRKLSHRVKAGLMDLTWAGPTLMLRGQ